MPLPKFPIVETDITGFTNLMDMNSVLTELEQQKAYNQQAKVGKSVSLSKDQIAEINAKILSEYRKNLRLLLNTIDENPDGFFIYSIVNMFEFYAQNILPKYTLEERLSLYPEFGALMVMALALNFEQQKLLVYKVAEDEKAIEYWQFLKTKVGVLAKPVLSKERSSEEMFSLPLNEIIFYTEIIFFNDAADNPILKKLGVAAIKNFSFHDFNALGMPITNRLQGNEDYINEFLASSDIKPKFEDIQKRTSLLANDAIEGIVSSLYGRSFGNFLGQLGISDSNIFSCQKRDKTSSGISQELFDKWVEKNKPARFANPRFYADQIKIFSSQQSKTVSVEAAAAEANDLVRHSFDIYLNYALDQAIGFTIHILKDNQEATKEKKLKILSQYSGGGLLNFFQYFSTRYNGYSKEFADVIDAFFEFAGDDFELKNIIISALHYSVKIPEQNYKDVSFAAYRDNMPVILSKIIIYSPIYLFTSKEFSPLLGLFYNYGLFPEQKIEFESKISSLLDDGAACFEQDIRYLEFIKAQQFFEIDSSLFRVIQSSSPEIAEFLKLCFYEKIKYNIDYHIKKSEIIEDRYKLGQSQIMMNAHSLNHKLERSKPKSRKAIEVDIAYNQNLLSDLKAQYLESKYLVEQQYQSIFSTFDHALPLFSLEMIENLLDELQAQIRGEELKPKEKIKLQYILAEALFTAETSKGKKPQFVNSNFAVLLNKGSKKIIELITQVKLDPALSNLSEDKFKSYFYQQSFITLLSVKNFDNLNYLYSLDEEFFDTQFIPTGEEGQFIKMIKNSLVRFSFDHSLVLLENIIADSELARFLKQTLIFNENNFPRFQALKSYFDNELIISSFFSGDNFKATKFYQYIAAKNYDALNLLNAIDDKELKVNLFIDTAKFLEANDAEALAKLVQLDPELYQQCLDQGDISTGAEQAITRFELLQSIESAKDSNIDDLLPQISEAFSPEFITKYLFGSTKFEETKFYTFLIAGSKEVFGFLNEKFVSDIESLSEFKLKAFSGLITEGYFESLDVLLMQNLEFFALAFERNEKFRGEVIGKVEALNIEDLSFLDDVISSESFLKKLINLNIALKAALSSEVVTQELDQKLKDFSIYKPDEISALLQTPVAGDECLPLCYDLILKGSNVILSQLDHLEDNHQNQIFLYRCFHELIVAKRFDDLKLFSKRSLEIINKSFGLAKVKEECASEILPILSKANLKRLNDVAAIVPNVKVLLEAHIIKLFSDDIKLGQTILPELAFYQESFVSLCSDYVFNKASLKGSRFFDILSSNQDLARVLFRDFCQEPKDAVIGEELLIYFLREGQLDGIEALLFDHPVLFDDILAKPEFKSQLKAICDNIKDPDTIESLKAITSHSQFASLIQEFLNPLNRELSLLRKSNHNLKQLAKKEITEFDQEFDALKRRILTGLSKVEKQHSSEIAALREEVVKEKSHIESTDAKSRKLATAQIQLQKEIKQFETKNRELQEELRQKQAQLDREDLAFKKQEQELQLARKISKSSEKTIKGLRDQLQSIEASFLDQRRENEKLKMRNRELSTAKQQDKDKVLTQKSQLEKQQEAIGKLQKQSQAGDEEKARLVSDNSRLREEIKSLTAGSSEELQKANAEIARLKKELAAKTPATPESRLAGHVTRSIHPHTQRFQNYGQVPGFAHPQMQRSQAAAEEANFSVSKSLFKQQFYSYFDFNAGQDGKLNLKSHLITNGYIQGYVNYELVARELKIAYNAGENCFFPVAKEELDKKLDEYLERPRSQSSRDSDPISSLIQILPFGPLSYSPPTFSGRF